tara:strand:- start:11324 stop:11443 length:120 start_codon:yes stop_codon:yes gene_type:complete
MAVFIQKKERSPKKTSPRGQQRQPRGDKLRRGNFMRSEL